MTQEKIVSLRLSREMVGQILDGLGVLAADWEFTRDFGEVGMCEVEGDRHLRECRDAEEAGKIAGLYREIIEAIGAAAGRAK